MKFKKGRNNNKADFSSKTKPKNSKKGITKSKSRRPMLKKKVVTKSINDKSTKFEKPAEKNPNEKPVAQKTQSSKFKHSSKGKPNLDKAKLIKTESIKDQVENEKPNWLEYKKQQKELREKRRAKKLDDAYSIAVEAKKIGEQLRKSTLKPEIQEKLTKKLHNLLQNQYAKMIFMHDLSRVIQWHIKYSKPDIQLALVEELKPSLREMFFSKYSKNVVSTLLKRGSDPVKKCVAQVCYGSVVKLSSSVLSAPLFEKIYVEVASDSEKALFKQELYGDMYKKSKEPSVKTLTDAYKNSEGMKTATLSAVKANLIKILNKNLINSTLVHTVLYEYLLNCSKEDKNEIMALARPLIAELSQTKDGARAGNICIWDGSNKDRKLIMKTLKEHVKNISTSEHGYLMILALLDSVDDTVLLKKIILQEIITNLDEIATNEYGRLVILYLIARRDTHYFHPTLVEYLKSGDNNETSKKPAEIRSKELLEGIIDHLLENISQNLKIWLSNGSIQIVTLAALNNGFGPKLKTAFESISEFITNSESVLKKDDKEIEVIEDAGLHFLLKKLIQMDHKRIEANQQTFSEVLVQFLTVEALEHWTKCNRSCFLLVNLFENASKDVVLELKKKVENIANLNSKKSKGAKILLEKLQIPITE